jgi:hypothetical protein
MLQFAVVSLPPAKLETCLIGVLSVHSSMCALCSICFWFPSSSDKKIAKLVLNY